MKAVLMSIQPKWVELILNGKKTIEVRKTAPKLETPFKVYVYCTIGKPYLYKNANNDELFLDSDLYREGGYENRFLSGKVVAEFVCDRINEYDFFIGHGVCGYVDGCESHCLTKEKLCEYGNGKNLYGWHISDIKIYDQPKELSEFRLPCDKFLDCLKCHRGRVGDRSCQGQIERAPQSWCYVEEVEE